jgi:hypothetical protein
MGFTERASCRPYKNCYKKLGGAKTMKSKKSKKDSLTSSSKHLNKPAFIYHSELMSYTSHPEKNESYGERTVINITNGRGKKRIEILDKEGKSIKVNAKKLAKKDVNQIKQEIYNPGLLVSV